MIEVTEEMRCIVHKLDTLSGEYVDNVDYVIRSIIELHEANKPKPEPVGYAWIVGDQIQKLSDAKLNKSFVPLYTTPPTREPLSDEQIDALVPWQGDPKDPYFSRIEFARAIEQAHGIGVNHD